MPYIGVSPTGGVRKVFSYTATAGQTSFSGSDNNSQTLSYSDSNFIDVFQNGVLLLPSDYTATTGTSVVLDTGATVSDSVQITVFDVFSVSDTVSKADGGTFDGNVATAGTLGVTGATTLTGALSAKGGAVFNEDSADVDFRVESNDSANMLVVNAGTNRIGIGTDSPSHPLHIETSSDGTGVSGADLFAAFIKNPESTSGQSYGLKIQAASTTDQMLNLTTLDAAYTRFYVQGNGFTRISADNASGYAFKVAHDGDNSNRYGIAIQTGSDAGSGTNYLLGFQDGDGNSVGSITFSGGTVSYNPFTASHPCIVPNSDNDKNSTANAYPYGTLLEVISISYTQKDGADSERGILYNVQKSSSAKSKAVIGAYSSSMNGSSLDENTVETNKHLVHVLGDGHILCNNENGNIAVGDYICTSSTSGEGMKATSICATIGIAREAITFKNSKAVLVAVEYGYRQFIPEDIEARITALESK
tara:strand:- start:407 stop:1831 length:1425 start_codon:yes stop_codon:yes gene_type:complete